MGAAATNPAVLRVIPPPADSIARRIRARQRFIFFSGLFLLTVGLPAVLVGPAVVATMLWFLSFAVAEDSLWRWFFLATSLVMTPIMFIGEARHRGGAFAVANPDAAPGDLDSDSLSPLPMMVSGHFGILIGFTANPRLATSSFMEVFLIGPRLTLDGLMRIRRSWQLRDVSAARAAEMVARLAAANVAVPIEWLLRPGETVAQLVSPVCLLLFQEWIGISRTGYRIWLLTKGRQQLRS